MTKLVFNPIQGALDLVASSASDVGLDGLDTNITAGKTLTLAATDNYTLTVPATGIAALLGTANVFTTQQMVDGTSDQIQLRLQGHSTQTNPVITIETSAAAQNFMIYPTGRVRMGLTNYSQATDILHVAENQSHSSGNRNLIYTESVYATQTSGTGSVSGFVNNILINALTGSNPTSGLYTSIYGTMIANNIASGRTIGASITSYSNLARAYASSSMAGTYNNLTCFGSDLWGFSGTPAGVISNLYGLRFSSPVTSSSGGGSITNVYGIYLNSITGGTTINYAIYTNLGLNRLGDQLLIDGSADRIQQIVQAHSTQTTNLQEWQDSSATVLASVSGTGTVKTSGRRQAVTTKSADYTATANDEVIVFTATATLTLPAATGSGQYYRICNEGVGATVTIDGNGTDTIKRELTQTIAEGEDIILNDYATGKWV